MLGETSNLFDSLARVSCSLSASIAPLALNADEPKDSLLSELDEVKILFFFFRRMKMDMKRNKVQSSDPNLFAIGFTGQNGKQKTLILMNRDTASIITNIDRMDNFTWQETTSQYYRNYIMNEMKKLRFNRVRLLY